MTPATVVTVVHGRHEHLLAQADALSACGDVAGWVVVAMDDRAVAGLVDGQVCGTRVLDVPVGSGLPLAAARNAGACAAFDDGAELVVFLDVDCLPARGLVTAYAEAARAVPRALLSGPVAYLPPAPPGGYRPEDLAAARPHPARPAPAPGHVLLDPDGHALFWSLSFAATGPVWDAIGGFDEVYVGYGAEDTDFGRRAARAGLPLAWVGSARAWHQYHPVSRPPVEHVADIVRNGRLFADRWGSWPMGEWLAAFAADGLVRGDPQRGYRLA